MSTPMRSPKATSRPAKVERQGPPPRVPDYELVRVIGRGSYGEVWLARSLTGAFRAAKVIYRATFESERPYEREFRGILKFEPISRTHESQVDVLHVGRNDAEGYFYYVMELADDERTGQEIQPDHYSPKTLKSELNLRGRLPFGECIELGVKLTTALDHLHQNGLVHRDIKPSNIIFVSGSSKLADIGLVTTQDATISFVGTIGYLAPEGPGTPQADLYSLGKVLYEASTGKDRSAFPEPSTELGAGTEVGAQAELNEIILKACASTARERYQSAQEMKADLLLLQSGKSIKRLRRLERRLAVFNRVGLAVVVLALLAVGAFLNQRRQSRQLAHLEHESRERAVRLSVAQGSQRIENGDYFNSLVWFTEALRLAAGNPGGEAIHRHRIEAVRRRCPKLVAFGVHSGPILHAEFSPDGRRILTAGGDGTARVWDTATSEPVSPPLTHRAGLDAALRYATFSPDGRRVATASDDNSARIWEVATGELVCKPLTHGTNVVCVAFSPDGRRIVTSSFDQSAVVWDVDTGEPVASPLLHRGGVEMAIFSPDGQWVATASRDHTARIWDAQTGRPASAPLNHEGVVKMAVFSADGRRVLTASYDGSARIWDVVTGEPLTRPLRQRGRVTTARFSPDERRIVTAGGIPGVVGEARVWDAATGELISVIDRHERPILHARFSPDGRWIATASVDRTARVWDAETGGAASAVFNHNHTVTGVSYSSDGRKLLTVSRDQVWRIWDLVDEASLSSQVEFPHVVWNAGFDPTGQWIVAAVGAAEGNGKAYVLSVSELWRTNAFVEHTEGVEHATFSPDGKSFVTAGVNILRVWDTLTCRPVTPPIQLVVLYSPGRGVACSPDGQRLAIGADNKSALILNATTGDPITPPLQHEWPVQDVAFSPDGRRLATGAGETFPDGPREARIWDATTGQLLVGPLKASTAVVRVRFSPEGQRLLTACADGFENPCSAELWDARTGKPTGIVLAHADGVPDARFSPDGRLIVTASEDCTARVWDSNTGAPFGQVMRHKRSVFSAEFSPDGRRIATASHDGTARVWDALTGEPISPPLKCRGEVWSARFSPDGQKVVVASGSRAGAGQVRLWELPEAKEPVEDLVAFAQLLSGTRLDQTGALVPIALEELLQMWRAKANAARLNPQ